MQFINYDLFNLILCQERLNYKVLIKYNNSIEKIKFKTCVMSNSFGIEKYMGKNIINLRFPNIKNDKQVLDFYESFKRLDYFMVNFKWDTDLINKLTSDDTKYVIKQLKGTNYVSCIKKVGDYDPVLRLHFKTTGKTVLTEFYKTVNNEKVQLITNISNEIKNKPCIAEIEIGMMYLKDSLYGFTFYLLNYEIL